MTRLPALPDLEWRDDGTPVARAFDDVYFSQSDGLEETRSVFLKACGLPEGWADKSSYVIAELGFGTGLNFLGTLDMWEKSARRPDAWLHFLSVEKFPLPKAAAEKAFERWPDLKPYAEALLKRWPDRAMGLYRIDFPEFQASLTLYIGEADDWLSTAVFKADAWFLDGFAPAKNETMWSEALLQKLGPHCHEGTRIGTYTVAGAVRRGLAAAGFSVEKAPGFGRKRERLVASWQDPQPEVNPVDMLGLLPPEPPTSPVIIAGAGIAGAVLAHRFAMRGFEVILTDRSGAPASGASGNPYGLIMPRLDAGDTPQARLLIQNYLSARRFFAETCPDAVQSVSVRQSPQSSGEQTRFEKLKADPPLDETLLGFEESEAGLALLHHGALLIEPAKIVETLTRHEKISFEHRPELKTLPDLKAHYGENALIVLAGGSGLGQMMPEMELPITGKLGQVDWAPLTAPDETPRALASGSYALKTGTDLLFGATFEAIAPDEEPESNARARSANLAALRALKADWLDEIDGEALCSRASVRATTPDRMPIAGRAFEADALKRGLAPLTKGAPLKDALSYHETVYILGGFGARGFTFAPLLADLIVSQCLGEPLPLARPELEQVASARFVIRAMKRGAA